MNRPTYFEVLADDPLAVAEFYDRVLGWKVNLLGADEQRYWQVETGDGPGIDGGMMHRHFPQAVINTIDVASLDDVIANVKSNGGKLVHGPHDIPEVGRHAYCADPEGNLFGLLQASRRQD